MQLAVYTTYIDFRRPFASWRLTHAGGKDSIRWPFHTNDLTTTATWETFLNILKSEGKIDMLRNAPHFLRFLVDHVFFQYWRVFNILGCDCLIYPFVRNKIRSIATYLSTCSMHYNFVLWQYVGKLEIKWPFMRIPIKQLRKKIPWLGDVFLFVCL